MHVYSLPLVHVYSLCVVRSEFEKQKQKKRRRREDEDDDDDDSDDDGSELDLNDLGLSDEEMDFGNDEEFSRAMQASDGDPEDEDEDDEEGGAMLDGKTLDRC